MLPRCLGTPVLVESTTEDGKREREGWWIIMGGLIGSLLYAIAPGRLCTSTRKRLYSEMNFVGSQGLSVTKKTRDIGGTMSLNFDCPDIQC